MACTFDHETTRGPQVFGGPRTAQGAPTGNPDIVFIDDRLIVIIKPAGMLAVPGRREADCAWARVAARYADAQVVHRLDQATSGLMLLARGGDMQRALSMAFAAHQVDKHYEAVLHGLPAADGGVIDAPLAADWPRRPRQRVDSESGKPSRTTWRVLHRDAATQHTRVALQPQTGRTHQLRVHVASIGHPIVGDRLYGPPEAMHTARLLLHANRMAFAHPTSGRPMAFEVPAPF